MYDNGDDNDDRGNEGGDGRGNVTAADGWFGIPRRQQLEAEFKPTSPTQTHTHTQTCTHTPQPTHAVFCTFSDLLV